MHTACRCSWCQKWVREWVKEIYLHKWTQKDKNLICKLHQKPISQLWFCHISDLITTCLSWNAHAAQALKWKHEVVKTLWLQVNLAQQMPISCSSWPLCLLSCTSQDKRLDKKMVRLSQHLSCQQEHKNIRGCRTSRQPVMRRGTIEVKAWDVFCFCSNFPVRDLFIPSNALD